MIFAVDIGNTNITFGCLDDEDIFFVSRLATDAAKTEDQYAVELMNILSIYKIKPEQIEGAIISSSSPPLSDIMSIAVKLVTGHDPLLVGPGIKTGLNIKMENPAEVAGDLIVTAVAALAEYPLPIIIIDMGTATTMAILDDVGNYRGGAIVPGLRISLEALRERTVLLPQISLEAPKAAIGGNTVEAMKSGIVLGTASMIDGMVKKINAELKAPASVVATGGLAHFVIPHCESKIFYDGDLMLKGLRILYRKNK